MAHPMDVRAEVSGAFTLGGLGLGGIYFPIGGFILGVAGTVLAIRALRRDRETSGAIWALCLCTTDMALSVSGFIWSLFISGLGGIVTSPAPP
jgi:hypothetical protein